MHPRNTGCSILSILNFSVAATANAWLGNPIVPQSIQIQYGVSLKPGSAITVCSMLPSILDIACTAVETDFHITDSIGYYLQLSLFATFRHWPQASISTAILSFVLYLTIMSVKILTKGCSWTMRTSFCHSCWTLVPTTRCDGKNPDKNIYGNAAAGYHIYSLSFERFIMRGDSGFYLSISQLDTVCVLIELCSQSQGLIKISLRFSSKFSHWPTCFQYCLISFRCPCMINRPNGAQEANLVDISVCFHRSSNCDVFKMQYTSARVNVKPTLRKSDHCAGVAASQLPFMYELRCYHFCVPFSHIIIDDMHEGLSFCVELSWAVSFVHMPDLRLQEPTRTCPLNTGGRVVEMSAILGRNKVH